MTKEETTFPAELVSGRSMVQDDQYIEFYENNPNMIYFDPPLTIDEFKAVLEASFKYGKMGKSTGKMSGTG